MSADIHFSFDLPPLPYYLGCGKSVYAPGEQHPNRRHLGMFDLLLIVKGTLYMGEDERSWELSEGQMLLLRPEGHHYPTRPCAEETEFYWVHINCAGDWQEVREEERPLQPNRQPFANPYTLRLPQFAALLQPSVAFRIVQQLMDISGNRRSTAFWQEQALCMELLRLLEQESRDHHSSPVMKLAEAAEAFLKQNYRKDITNEALSNALHFHSNYIVRCMKEVYRCTPMEYLHEYRIEQAKRLLITTEWPIAQIAEYVGFSYTPYFSSCFQKSVGLPPLRFRKQYFALAAR